MVWNDKVVENMFAVPLRHAALLDRSCVEQQAGGLVQTCYLVGGAGGSVLWLCFKSEWLCCVCKV